MNEMPSVFRSSKRTARKAHRCCECTKEIQPGEQYVEQAGCWDGSWQTYKQCCFCALAAEEALHVLYDRGYYSDEGPAFCGLWAWMEDAEMASPIWR